MFGSNSCACKVKVARTQINKQANMGFFIISKQLAQI
jgi:hypothetical protein